MHRDAFALTAGSTFDGRCEILAKLGEGGFGAVYKARQLNTGQLVALKVMAARIRDDATQTDRRAERFLRETKLCAQLHHPNIVKVIDSGQTAEGDLYTMFAFAPGDNLADVLAREGALMPLEAQHLMLQVVDALACAHAQGIVHRDLKPSNIMVIPTGARRNALVLDFGISAIITASSDEPPPRITATNDTLGTPGYGSPEQWRGTEAAPSADLFSWGLVFLECLTGRAVYDGTSAADILYQLLGPEAVPIPNALELHPLGELLRLVTRKDVAGRTIDARLLFKELERCDLRQLPRGVELSPHSCNGFVFGNAPSLLSTESSVGATGVDSTPAVVAERRQLTALCCRCVVEGRDSVDDEESDEILREALSGCAAMARRHGGRVAAALGNELLVYFGHPRAEEDDVVRAARAALALAEVASIEATRLSKRGLRVDWGAGIHTGFVVAGGGGEPGSMGLVVGATPQLAGQLAAAAAPGIVLVSTASERLLRSSFELRRPPTPEHAAARTESFVLLREFTASTPSTIPEASLAPLIGREHEVALLLERWRRMQSVGGQCGIIVGEPGIGKSRLARELRRRLVGEDHVFVEARCAPDTRDIALFPIVALLERALGLEQEVDNQGKTARLEAGVAGYGAALAAAMPLLLPVFSLPLADSYQPLDVSPLRRKDLTLNAVASLLFAMAEKRPLLMLVEDLHWADPTTLALLGRLAEGVSSVPMYLLLTARPEFVPSFSMPAMLQLPLSRLGREDIKTMLLELLGHKEISAAAVERVVVRTDGVPLFVEELTRMMVESGLLLERENHFELSGQLTDIGIPSSLRGLLTVRLDRLERARETAQIAAALGREFNLDQLLAVASAGSGAVLEDLDKLASAGLVLRKQRSRDAVGVFKHALVRDAAYESLSRSARIRVHSRIAAVLEEQFQEMACARPALLAHHHASAEQAPQAVRYAQLAAAQDLQATAYAEAIAQATNVINWAPALEPSERVEAELTANGVLAQAMMATRGWADPEVKAIADRSAVLLQQLDRQSAHRVPALWSLFAFHHTASNRRDALEVAEEMVSVAEGVGDPGLRATAATIHGIALHPQGKFVEAAQALERAINLYDPVLHRDQGPRIGLDSLVLARTLLAHLRWFAGEEAIAFELVQDALTWAREVKHVPSLAIGLLYGCQVYQLAGDKATAGAMASEILALAERYGLPAYEGYAAIIHAWSVGDEERAGAILAGLVGMGCKLCLSYYGSLRADNLADRGALDEASDCIEHCLALCVANNEHFYEPELHRRRALYRIRRGEIGEDARASLEHAIQLASRQNMPGIEARATLDLMRHFAGDGARQSRLDAMLTSNPKLRELIN